MFLPRGETAFLLPTNPTFNAAKLGGVYVKGYTLVDLHLEWNHEVNSRVNAALNVTTPPTRSTPPARPEPWRSEWRVALMVLRGW